MKKSLLVFSVLLLGAIGFLIYLPATLLAEKDNVTITDTVHYGDPSAAKGITATLSTHYDYRQFWRTHYEAGTTPTVTTNYTFSATQQRIPLSSGRSAYIDFNIDTYNFDLQKNPETLVGIEKAFFDLYQKGGSFSNETSAKQDSLFDVVYLKNYYDYYPLCISFSLENYDYFWDFMELYYARQYNQQIDETSTFLENYFRIPVLEDDTRAIRLDIEEDYSSAHIEYSEKHHACFMDSFSTATDDALFFTFSITNEGEPVDFDDSYIPGGYGIYRVPIKTSANNGKEIVKQELDIKNLSTAYPLEQRTRIFGFSVTEDMSRLLLLYQDSTTPQSASSLAVIDANTMELLQTIHLDGIERLDGSTEVPIPYSIHVYDDFIAIPCSGDYLAVIDVTTSGTLEYQFMTNLHENNIFDYYIDTRGAAAMDKKGDQIVISGLKTDHEGHYRETCGFYLAIFDKNGLVYFSEHDSSLDKGTLLSRTVSPMDYYNGAAAIQVEWQ